MGLATRHVTETSPLGSTPPDRLGNSAQQSSETNNSPIPQITMRGNEASYPIFNQA
jgi:hypothetical protein